MKTKPVDFGVFIHVDFISGYSDTKGVVGQYSTIFFSSDFSIIGLTQSVSCEMLEFLQKFNFFKNVVDKEKT